MNTLLWYFLWSLFSYLLINFLFLIKTYFQKSYSPAWNLMPSIFNSDSATFYGKNVVITGASSNFGRELTISIAKEVLDGDGILVLVGRNLQQLKELQESCRNLTSNLEPRIKLVYLDLIEMNTEQSKEILNSIPRIDYFFHNAGLRCKKLVEDISPEQDSNVLITNLQGHIYLTKQLLARLIQDQTRLVVTGSLSAILASPLRTTYTASKAGLHGFYLALMKEHPELRVTLLHLGPITEKNRSQMVKGSLNAVQKGINEIWIADQPYLIFAYLSQYYPGLAEMIDQTLGISRRMIRQFKKSDN